MVVTLLPSTRVALIRLRERSGKRASASAPQAAHAAQLTCGVRSEARPRSRCRRRSKRQTY
eukprot:scaffold5440_cov88-Isochrysis_galbana.AAC.7